MTWTRLAFRKTWGGLKVAGRVVVELLFLSAPAAEASDSSDRKAEKTPDVFMVGEKTARRS
jgi:hypothetical protein